MRLTGKLPLALTLSLAACRPVAVVDPELTAAERAAIGDSAIAVMRDGFDDVHRLDGAAAAARYAAVPEVIHVEDTVVMDGLDAIRQSFTAAVEPQQRLILGGWTTPVALSLIDGLSLSYRLSKRSLPCRTRSAT